MKTEKCVITVGTRPKVGQKTEISGLGSLDGVWKVTAVDDDTPFEKLSPTQQWERLFVSGSKDSFRISLKRPITNEPPIL